MAQAFEYLSLYQKLRKEMVILKLDFEKAFDKLEHAIIIDILKHKGFGYFMVKLSTANKMANSKFIRIALTK